MRLVLKDVHLRVGKDRSLVRDLSMKMQRDKAALVGRNGVGKSSLLRVLAGVDAPSAGKVHVDGRVYFLAQAMDQVQDEVLVRVLRWLQDCADGQDIGHDIRDLGLEHVFGSKPLVLSAGEKRKLLLLYGKYQNPDFLLLDEPTEGLDAAGVLWLRRWLEDFSGGLVVVSHERCLLADFSLFLVLAESGCTMVAGDLATLDARLEALGQANEERYARRLKVLAAQEEASERFRLRRQRKKNVGRVRELGRMTPRSRLNQKRSYAQEKQGRIAKIRETKIATYRQWAKSARRAMRVSLPMDVAVPPLAASDGLANILVEGVGSLHDGAVILPLSDFDIRRERVGFLGANGSGKSSLLRLLVGELAPDDGRVKVRRERIGYVDQESASWQHDQSLAELLWQSSESVSPADAAEQIASFGFPLSLAMRPLATLSAGERMRAALILLLHRRPCPEVLVLDEPTYALDSVGRKALGTVLQAWTGGLVVASHDLEFVESLRLDSVVTLGNGGFWAIDQPALPTHP